MRRTALCLMLIVSALPSFAAERVLSGQATVAQLEQWLASTKEKNDRDLAREISFIELTERLSSPRLQQLTAVVPGEKSQDALMALADVSAFLPPPADEIPATASPDVATQRRMMSLAVAYLAKSLPLLPNLFATRVTASFQSRPSPYESETLAENPLQLASRSAVTVFYRDGHEFLDAGTQKSSKPSAPEKGLTTWGEFGAILGAVFVDAAENHLAWSHWELSPGGPEAVFRYSVPVQKSHYDLRFCCVSERYGLETNILSERVGYNGEITLDPDSGNILRITVIADLSPSNPITQSDIAVEYGPEEIGGRTYFCPVKAIALARAPDLSHMRSAAIEPTSFGGTANREASRQTALPASATGRRQTLLNDVAFHGFHIFRSESRILTAKEAASESRMPAAAAPTANAGAQVLEFPKPAEEVAMEAAAAAPPPVASPVPPPEPVLPEIAVSGAAGLPDTPAAEQSAGASSNFRLNARLVDVSLVALDKKGHPVTNLKPEDLEIFDDKAKVDLRSFSLAESAPPPQPVASAQPNTAPGPEFSNRLVDSYKSGPTEAQLNTIVLLLDNTLSFADLSNVREQMEQFLKGLHGDERVAIYTMRPGGFDTLQDTTTDHSELAAKLAKWTPSAQNVALGQEQEARNRQQMEYVRNVDDMLSVNGNTVMDSQGHVQAPDPKLRELGDNPGRDALSGLVILARHLATIHGHKSLVWIASDNTLADWNYSALNIEKGSRNIEPAALSAQEAMNDAHVSVYPLDASQLEAGGIDASIADRNVQLNPTATANQMGSGCGLVSAGGTTTIGGRVAQLGGGDPALSAGPDITTCTNDLRNGRMTAQMQQDLHSIQGVYREIADATGGRAFRRASDITGELNGVADDGRATYLLSFTPAAAADGKYHLITVKAANRKNLDLRYRTGYFYRQEPSSMKDRFREVAFQPEDARDIGLSADLEPQANPNSGATGRSVKLSIAAADLALAQKDAFWTDKLDVFVVQRKFATTQATVAGQSIGLRLKPESYQKYLREGLPFNQIVELARGVGAIRIVVVDENSGRMGSVTIPAAAFAKPG